MIEKQEADRRTKLDAIREMGVNPFGGRYDEVIPAAEARTRYAEDQPPQSAKVAGRIVLMRVFGKLAFVTLRDSSGDIQLGLSKNKLADAWPMVKKLDLGDIIGADGEVGVTKTGEITVWANELKLLSKCLLPPPEKFHSMQDAELRYRRRYVDLFANPESMQVFRRRSEAIEAVRRFLLSRNFLEVETPVLQAQYGGAAARPFVTHHNTLDADLFMRISPELFLKRLLVGGMERVFEFSRNFRNEGIDTSHNPEFTLLEVYQAYSDYEGMMELTESMVAQTAENVFGGLKLPYGKDGDAEDAPDRIIDYTTPWRRATYADLLKEHAGVDINDIAAVRAKARELEIEEAGKDDTVVINEVFEETVEPHLIQPTFVIDYPAPLCPLTRRKEGDPSIALRFEAFVCSMELANAYTELNDPDVQLETFQTQLAGQHETMATMDADFVRALKYGMPPAGGMGIGIDRMIMLLANRTSIRDVILFPLLRQKEV